MSVSFPKLGKFSVMLFSDMFSAPFSLSSPSENPITQILMFDVVTVVS